MTSLSFQPNEENITAERQYSGDGNCRQIDSKLKAKLNHFSSEIDREITRNI